MSMQLYSKGHDFPKDEEGGMLNLELVGGAMCQPPI